MIEIERGKMMVTDLGVFPDDWEIEEIENVLEVIIDYRGKTPTKSDDGIITLSAKSVKQGYIDYANAYYVSKEAYDKFMVRGFPQVGDILLTTEAPLGCVARLDRNDVCLAQRLITLRGKKDKVLNDYIYYYLQSSIGQHELNSRATGTTVVGIKRSEFSKVRIVLPPLEIQERIVSILNSIDKKVDLNKKLNANLEELVSCYFAKIYNSDTRVKGNMSDIVKFSNGKKKPNITGAIPIYGGNGVLGYTGEYNYEDVIIVGRVGAYCGSLYYEPGKCWVSDNAIAAKSKIKDNYYTYELLKTYNLNNMHIGSSQPLLTQGILNSIEINMLNSEVIRTFNNWAEPFYKLIDKNNKENCKLQQLREVLLPQLMSGAIDLLNIEI